MGKTNVTNRGFTLIETLIVLLLLATLLGATGFMFIVSLRAWDAGCIRGGIREDISYAMEKTVRDLKEMANTSLDQYNSIAHTIQYDDLDGNTYVLYLYNTNDSTLDSTYSESLYDLRKANIGGSGRTVAILGSWTSGLTHTAESGSNRALIFIAHEESISGSPTLTSVTYGGQAMTKIIERSAVAAPYGNYVAAFILDEAGINAATSGTFVPTWSAATSSVSYASVFLSGVNQTTLVGESASNRTTGTTPNPITTSALATNSGDMVIVGAASGNNGSYTLNNGFTEGTDQSVGVNGHTGVTGHKGATGADETPSATHSNPNRQVIIGFVVQGPAEESVVTVENVVGTWQEL